MTRTPSPSALFGLYTLVLLAANVSVLHELVDLALANPTASHVVGVPLVTLVILFQDRSAIFAASRPAWRRGLAVVLAGLTVLVLGRLGSGFLGREPALSVAIGGIVLSWVGGFLFTYGWKAARAAIFPLSFLLFAVPLPDSVVAAATEFLKRGSTETVAGLLALTGTPFHRDGFVFSLPGFAIEVADECSGIRSSIALLLTGLLASRAFLRSPWTKAILVLAVLPIAVLKNGTRIASLTLLAMHVDPGFLVGQLHHDGGFVFFLLALAMLAPLLYMLRRLEAWRIEQSHA